MKTSELTGAALDGAVAKCEGIDVWKEPDGMYLNDGGEVGFMYRPSTDWSQGGPIIERERISVRRSDGQWVAEWWADNSGMAKSPAQRFVHNRFMAGTTPLIAAMRCFVASKLGEDVNIPSELEAA